jgi:GNAT superfamily N-acetyltransferase
MYGYMRVYEDQADVDVRDTEQLLRGYAEKEGQVLAGLFQEEDDGRGESLTALIAALKRTGAGLVVTPSLRHFGVGEALREQRLAWLESETGANVVEVAP